MEADSWSWPLASVCTCRHTHACICAHVYTYTGTHTCATPKKIKLKFLKEKNLHENALKKVFISLLFQKGTGRWHQKGGSQRSTLSGLHLNPWQPCCLEENVKNRDTFFYLREILRSPMQWHSGGWLWTHEERCSKIHTGSLMLKHANLFHQWARQLLSFVCKLIVSWLESKLCHFLAAFDLQTAAGLFLVQSTKQQQGGKKTLWPGLATQQAEVHGWEDAVSALPLFTFCTWVVLHSFVLLKLDMCVCVCLCQ